MNDHATTTAPSKSTTLPEATRITAGQGVKTDSESRPQSPTTSNVSVQNQTSVSGCSHQYIAGTVIVFTYVTTDDVHACTFCFKKYKARHTHIIV